MSGQLKLRLTSRRSGTPRPASKVGLIADLAEDHYFEPVTSTV